MSRLFGTDGIRGIANSELTVELAFKLGKAGAYVLKKENERPTVLIGKDTRVSGDMLENALAAGVLSMGGNVIKIGVLPTPAVAHLVKYFRADAGVVISASHNPFEYNGIKFFNGEGFKLDDSIEDQIEDIIRDDIDVNSHVTGEKLGRCLEGEENALNLYVDFLKQTTDIRFDGLKIALDCANGAAYKAAKKVYQELGADVVSIFDNPDGQNINDKCGSTHPEKIQALVAEIGADIGFAYDGDADRLISIDEKGRIIDGDKTICICANRLKEEGELTGGCVTATVMSNLGLHKYMKSMGITVDVTTVGDRYVLERMLNTGCVIGGEQSGHIIFLNRTTTGDGILSSIQLLRAIIKSGKKPSELSDEIAIYPQVLKNASIKNENKKKYAQDPEIVSAIAEVEEIMAGEGRVLIRPSGTEPLVRVMIEGRDIQRIDNLANKLAALLEKKFS
ncbi:MAG: phosphoglucosamine mutase [Eubacteriales bacterium]|nr:phosphoglucosamine mutase [Eubacteriales bacterium]MDD4389588.1 phosphoglucosamine mutase [Eubacteriales bacterium]